MLAAEREPADGIALRRVLDGELEDSFEELPQVKQVRYGSGLQIDVTIDGNGYRFAAGSDMKMEEATGVPAAAGVLLMLRRALAETGVWAPECLRPLAFFQELRRVSLGGGGLHVLLLRDGQPAGRARIRDLLRVHE